MSPTITRTPHILIFDSGIGGLSITEAILEQHPHVAISYASDNAAFPYGTKTEAELIQRVDQVLHELQTITKADIIVVACNTVSTIALPKIREQFSLPIVGVVPAIKPAAQISTSKSIGLLATPGTVDRQYTQQLIDNFASHCRVTAVGSSELVQLAEKQLRGELIDQQQLASIVAPFAEQGELDTMVLACTHFPLLKKALQSALPKVVHWVDSGEAIARRVGYWLTELDLPLEAKSDQEIITAHQSFFTAEQSDIEQLRPVLEERLLGNIRFVHIN